MPSNRCSICSIDWPQNSEYKTCPACRLRTRPFSNIDAISDREAKSLKSHFEFDHFCVSWDEGQNVNRHDPAVEQEIDEKYGQAYFDAKVAEHKKPSRRSPHPHAGHAS